MKKRINDELTNCYFGKPLSINDRISENNGDKMHGQHHKKLDVLLKAPKTTKKIMY